MCRFSLVSITILFLTSISVLAEKTPTILTLGDSITEGGKGFVCYREILVPELRKKNIAFKFIGPKTDAVSAHAGYSGKNTGYLLSISKKTYRDYPADIVMIHSGHNSFSKDKLSQELSEILRPLLKISER